MEIKKQQKNETLADISDRIYTARVNRIGLDTFPGSVPATLEDAYYVQDLSMAKCEEAVIGWKVGGIPPSWQNTYDGTRLSGPIYASSLKHATDDSVIEMPVFADGYAGIEAEFIIELKDTSELPDRDLSEQQVIGAIKTICIGAEIASSPIKEINTFGPAAPICDFGNNSGLIIGKEITNWQEIELSEVPVVVDIDGTVYGPTMVGEGLSGPLGATKFLIEQLKQRGYAIPEGTYVSTGAITGVHDSEVGAKSTITFEGLGSFKLQLISNSGS